MSRNAAAADVDGSTADDGSRSLALGGSAAASAAASGLATSQSSTAGSDDGTGAGDDDDAGGFWPLVVTSLYQSVSATAGGVVEFARSVAAELADLERAGADADADAEADADMPRLRLPWEVAAPGGAELAAVIDDDDGGGGGAAAADLEALVEDEALRAKILRVSHESRHFLEPHMDAGGFVLNDRRILLIRELLEMDPVLARTHARTSSRTSTTEARFWRNYFHHCRRVREAHLAPEEPEPQDASTILSGDDSSYVCVDAGSRPPSAPSSGNVLSKSADDVVILGTLDAFPMMPPTQGEAPSSPDKSQRHVY